MDILVLNCETVDDNASKVRIQAIISNILQLQLQKDVVLAVVMWPEVLGDLYWKPTSTVLLNLADNLDCRLLIEVPTSDANLGWLSNFSYCLHLLKVSGRM